MSDPAIGNGDLQQQVKVHVIPAPGGAKLRFTAADGTYLGSVKFDTINPQALGAIGNAFQQFAAQQSGGIQIANGMPGLRT